MVFSFSAVDGLFSFFTSAPANENKRDVEKDRTESEGGWQGASGGAVSDKRSLGWFGAKSAQSETPVRAAAERQSTRIEAQWNKGAKPPRLRLEGELSECLERNGGLERDFMCCMVDISGIP